MQISSSKKSTPAAENYFCAWFIAVVEPKTPPPKTDGPDEAAPNGDAAAGVLAGVADPPKLNTNFAGAASPADVEPAVVLAAVAGVVGAFGAKENADFAPLVAAGVLVGAVDALGVAKLNNDFVGSVDLVGAAPLPNTLCVWVGVAPKGKGAVPDAEDVLGVELAPNADEVLGFEPAPNGDVVLVAPNTDLPVVFCPAVAVALGKADEVPNADDPPPKLNCGGAEGAVVVEEAMPLVAEAGVVGVLKAAKVEGAGAEPEALFVASEPSAPLNVDVFVEGAPNIDFEAVALLADVLVVVFGPKPKLNLGVVVAVESVEVAAG